MRKLVMLSYANIRKTKGHTVSLFLMFLIAALLLNAGSLVSSNFGSFFEKITTELKASDVYYIIPNCLYSEKVDQYVKTNKNVLNVQKEEALWVADSMTYNGETREVSFLIRDADKQREFSKWKFIGEHLPPDSMSIYLPYVMNIDSGYKLNDKFELTFKDTTFTFTIKGFTEDTFFSSLDTGSLGVYLPHETYEKLGQQAGDSYHTTLLFADLDKLNSEVEAGIRELLPNDRTAASALGNDTSTLSSFDLKLVKMSRVTISSIVSVMMMAFAAIIAIVCLIMVRFRIGNSIEEDMSKIGSLKAIGYTSRQIMGSIVLQYSLIAFVGSLVGISLSYLTTPLLSNVFAHQSGLKWVQGFDGMISGIVLCALLVVVILVSFFTSGQLRKLNPIVALRGGIVTHSFRKNHMPLHRTRGRLPFVLGLKSMLQNRKQSIMIGIILAAVSFASTFGFVMFYNTTVDTKAFAETPGIELSNAIAILKPDRDHAQLIDSLKNRSEVRKVQFIDQATLKMENNDVKAFVMDDFSTKETDTVYRGRYPLHSNEIVLAGVLADKVDKTIGDRVTIRVGENQAEYRITGLSQGSNMGGMNASIRRDGMLQLNPAFKQQSLQIYLNSGSKADEFVKMLERDYGDSLNSAIDMDKTLEQGMGMYTSIVSKLGTTMMAITIVVVILVLYFVINSSVIRKKRELGIQKAIGFTTLQLMNQLSLGLLPPILIGVVIGSAVGITQTNAIMSVAQRAMGIMKAQYIITTSWISLFGVALVLVSYLTSMLITYRIRKISAYALVSE
ncbi:ABC transporter permease [Gorillibacterium sp. sgz5001074]|uniref:ABC transporter permease n=1 Tax=Gorillibacterium sp. sgz5001074 TaxID=3446695 RepID=UPI003F66DFD8